MFEHAVRVPLMMRLPEALGGIGRGRVDDADVSHLDIAPTLAELAGGNLPNADGYSLAPLISGRGAAPPPPPPL
ncbi:MAG: sulfatase-like hydrolase/transferase [Verrucomicrobiae bacterium]|nr:sulfatase-like hydrolase/transferase [Verrucomicrobiae bacterium]